MVLSNAVEKQAIRNLEIAENIKNLYEEMKNKYFLILCLLNGALIANYIFTNQYLEIIDLHQKMCESVRYASSKVH